MKAYIVNQNATQAAIEAGYAVKSAHVAGSRLLRNAKVKEMIDHALERVAESQQVRAEAVIRETRNLAFSNILNYVSIDNNGNPLLDISRINRDTGSVIKALKIIDEGEGIQRKRTLNIVLHDKLKALDKLFVATGVYRKGNKGIYEETEKVKINVITEIPGASGSKVKQVEENNQ